MSLKIKEYAVILLIIGFVAYLPSLFGNFVWDDEDFVTQNTYVQQFQVGKFFTENAVAGRGKTSNYYRPIQFTIYSLIYRIAGPQPFVFHLTGILLHLAAGLLIYVTLVYFFDALPAFVGALMFLVHPVQTESVSYISGLSDQLYTCFFIGALYLWLRRKEAGWTIQAVASLVLFILSFLSKELGIILPGILFIVSWIKRRSLRRDLPVLTVFFAVAGMYLLLRFTVLKFTDISLSWQGSPYGEHFTVRLATFFRSFFTFVSLILFPFRLYMERDYTTPVITNIFNVWTLLFIAVNAGMIFILYAKRKTQEFGHALLFYVLFVSSFVPYTGVFLLNGMFYEHYLYLPMAFFFAFAVSLLGPLFRYRSIQLALGVIICLFIFRSYARQWEWTDNERFYRQTLEHAPQSIRIINGLGMTLGEKGNCQEAIIYYQKALKLNPSIPNMYHNIANCYVQLARPDVAEKYYLQALKVDPSFQFSALSLLELYLKTGQKEKAKDLLRTTIIPRNPGNEELNALYGRL